MKARIVSMAVMACLIVLLFTFDIFSTKATSSMMADFQSVYGGGLVSRFGCEICHPPGSFTLNDYGLDLSDAVGFGCQDFNPPGTHTIIEVRGTCEAGHAPGYNKPLASNCAACHGASLTGGGSTPSCFLCHGKIWEDGGSNPCPDFSPPTTHNILEALGTCDALHAPGYSVPSSSNCTSCHGGDLTGGTGPSCYLCHGKVWRDSGSTTCPDFDAPSTHTILEVLDACDARHAAGYTAPMASNCFGCHGEDLTGAGAPSCYLCHDKVWQDSATNSCPDFNVPGDHSKFMEEDGCGAYHKNGWKNPLMNGCTQCHGGDLRGHFGPSCFLCHGVEWNTGGKTSTSVGTSPATTHPAGITAADFAKIEKIDSDGDGYTNKEEIDALTNPGDKDSVPLGKNAFTLQMAQDWQRSWISKRGEIGVRIRSNSGIAVDETKPITLSIGRRSLTSTKTKIRTGGFVEARFQKALLHCLIADLKIKKTTISIDGMLVDESEFSISTDITLSGNAPQQLNALRLAATPKELEEAVDVQLEIRGKNADEIDTSSKLVGVGVYRHLRLSDVEVGEKSITITLSARDIERLFGDLEPGVTYTLGVRGNGEQKQTVFCVTAKLKTPDDGGGDDGCLKFKPPSSHNVGLTSGECTYMHAPGFADPAANGCGMCHGADLKGSPIAPSCILCHGVKW